MATQQNANGFQSDSQLEKPGVKWAISPRDFIFKYIQYLPWILACVALFIFLAYLKIRYSTPIYHVESSLLIKNDNTDMNGRGNDPRFQEIFMSQGVSNLDDEIEILRSTPLIQRVVRNLNLQVYYFGEGNVKSSRIYPEVPFKLDILYLADSNAGLSAKVSILDSNRIFIGGEKTAYKFGQPIKLGKNIITLVKDSTTNMSAFVGTEKFTFGWQSQYDVAKNLIRSLRVVHTIEQSSILNLSFEGENVRLGKDVLNMIMAVFDSTIVEDKKRIQENTLHFINSQLDLLSDTLHGVEGGIKNFMKQNQAFDLEGQSKNYLEILQNNAKESDQQEVRLKVVDWLLDYIGDKKNIFELVPTTLGIEEPQLVQLMAEYNRLQLAREANLRTSTAENPVIVGMESSLDKIRRNIYQALLNVKQAYIIAGAKIKSQEEEMNSRVTTLPEKSMNLLNIQRRQRILEELYSLLLQKKLETQISSSSIVSASKVVEPAGGNGIQISPDKNKAYTLCVLFGLLIPIGIIAARELLQDKVSGRADVEKSSTIPILGEIGHSASEKSLVVTHNSRRLIAEQFRIARTNLQYITGKKDKPVIMVTSSFSGEGKSFISTNIGAVMALSGKKTVIMEFDIRKPKIVSGLDLKRKSGITNYIIGKAEIEDLLVKVDGVDDLYVIPCGPIPPNPAELLLDRRLDQLMRQVIERFEVIIMDTAPIGLVSDASNLARYADCTIYIVRQNQTMRKQLAFIDELYKSGKLPGLCLLINDMKAEGGYYGGYYGSRYGYYGGYGYGGDSGYFENEGKNGNGLLRRWKQFVKMFSTNK